MMSDREKPIQEFLDALRFAFAASGTMTVESKAFAQRLFESLDRPASMCGVIPNQLPVCAHLPAAIHAAQSASPENATLALTLAKIAPQLAWKVRPSGGLHASVNWPDGHANAVIVGQGGLEDRADVAIGVSLLAPYVRYPDHTHPPEELYLVLTPSQFQHGDEDWCEPGPGGSFHNSPGIKHAMASGEKPLLAIWTMVLN